MNTVDLKTMGDLDYLEIAIEAFLKDRKSQNLTKGSVEFYRHNLEIFATFLEGIEVKYISQITPNILRDFLLILEERGHNAGGIHAFYRSVKTFLRWYWDDVEPDTRNPIEKVKAPKLIIESLQGITREEFETLLSLCSTGFLGERDKAILLVLYDTGVRADELCNIKLEDVNLVENSIFISKGKGRKPRYVFFGKKTRKQVRKYLRFRGVEGSYLFVTRSGDKLIYTSLRQVIRRLTDKSGLKGVSLHDFRRAFCLNLLQAGVPEITIARLMGHTTTQLIGRYAKQTTVDLGNSYKSPVDE